MNKYTMKAINIKNKSLFLQILAFASAILFFSAIGAYPDAGPILFKQSGNYSISPIYGNHRSIIMESEEVTIKIHDGPENSSKKHCCPYADIKADMMFRNPTDKKVILDVGFPNLAIWDARDIKVFIDGIPADISKKHEVIESSLGKKPGEQKFPGEFMSLDWIIWKMGFKPGGLTRLTVVYKVSMVLLSYAHNDESLDKIADPMLVMKSGDATLNCPSYYGLLLNIGFRDKALLKNTASWKEYISKNNWTYGVSYIFHTGGKWNKTIGKAIFRISHDTKGSSGFRGCTAWKDKKDGGYTFMSWDEVLRHKEGGKPSLRSAMNRDDYTLEFTNVKPDFELFFVYHPELSIDEEIDIFMRMEKENPGIDLKGIIDYLKSLKTATP